MVFFRCKYVGSYMCECESSEKVLADAVGSSTVFVAAAV